MPMPLSELWSDASRWQDTPEVEWLVETDRQQTGRVLIANEPWQGQPTRVFAYVSLPDRCFDVRFDPATQGVPGVVCVHGGGGRAFHEWTDQWAARGYAAISMDLGGCGSAPDTRLPDGMPPQDHPSKFLAFTQGPEQAWTYHASAAVVRSASLLMSLPQVDATRVSLTGASWGGYMACVVAGLDPRLKTVVPVYGCGYLHEKSCWSAPACDQAISLSDEQWREWDRHYDPRHFLAEAKMPMLFVNGTNDFAYPPESWQKSTDTPAGPVTRSLRWCFKHSHPASWHTPEVARQIDYVTHGTPGPMTLGTPLRKGNTLAAPLDVPSGTTPDLPTLWLGDREVHWGDRVWQSVPARIEGDRVMADVPTSRPARAMAFLNVTDHDECVWSSPIVSMDAE